MPQLVLQNTAAFYKARYDVEYLELLKQLEREGIPPNEGTRLIEKHAYETLKAIEMEGAELEKAGNEGEDEGEVATGAFKKLQIGEHSGPEGQMEIDWGEDLKLLQVSSSRAKSTSTIEGMYTDDYGIKTKLRVCSANDPVQGSASI